MAANVVTTLGVLQQLAAEKAAFGQPDWTLLDRGTASANACVVAAVASAAGAPPVQHFVDRITLSYSAAPAVSTLQVLDGSTEIWAAQISATGPFVYDFDFSNKPLRNTAGASMTVGLTSAGGAIVQTVAVIGHSTRTITTFA